MPRITITDCRPSLEPCTESGWTAWDCFTSVPLDDEFILSLRPLGNFTYLQSLAKPFFKIQTDTCFIKGVKGTLTFRIAVPGEERTAVDSLLAFISGLR
jgi:hypothetical protein